MIYIDLDLNQNELQNAVLHQSSTAPSEPVAGQIYFNSTSKKFFYYDGTQWVEVANAANAGVTSFGVSGSGQTGDITVGNGLQMNSKEVSVKAKSGDYVTVDGNGVQLDSTKIDSAYTTANATNLATVASVTAAIGTLDVPATGTGAITGMGAGKTIATLTETDGKVAATFQDIAITHSQVSDWSSNVGVTAVAEGATNGTVAVTTNGGSATDVPVHGLDTAAYHPDTYFQQAFNDGSHDITAGSAVTGSTATYKVEFHDGTQTNGALGTNSAVADTMYFTEQSSASNPIVTYNDISGITGAMVYKGVVDGTHALPTTGVKAGWTYLVAADGTYAGQACQVGDMIVAQDTTPTWNVINKNVSVSDGNATLVAGGASQTVGTVEGVALHAKAEVTGGNAAIATLNSTTNVVTLKAGVTQTGTSGTIANDSGTDISLAAVAKTGAANELTVTSGNYGGDTATTNAQTALSNLATAVGGKVADVQINSSSIVNGTTKVADIAADGTYNATSNKIATQSTVTNAINALDVTTAVQPVAYTAATTSAGAKLDFKGVIETDGKIAQGSGTGSLQFAKVATSGSAADVSVTSGTYGGSTTVTTTQGALDNLTSAISAASISIDGQVGAITTGNGIKTLTASSKVIEVELDSTNAHGLSLSASGLAYNHNTTPITVASENSSTHVVTINGTLTPDASDAITASNAITLDPVAKTGTTAVSATDLFSVSTSGNTTTVTAKSYAQDAHAQSTVATGSTNFTIGDAKLNIAGYANGNSATAITTTEVFSANETVDSTITFNQYDFIWVGADKKLALNTATATSASNKIVTQSDIASMAGAMHYKGTVANATAGPWASGATCASGDTWIASADFTYGSGASAVSIEKGDMIVFSGTGATDFNVVQTNMSIGVSDGQIAENDGALTNGNIVYATADGIKTSSITESGLQTAVTNANSAVQSVSGQSALTGTNYVAATATTSNHAVTIASTYTQGVMNATDMSVTTAGMMTTDSMANVKTYIDNRGFKATTKNLTFTGSTSTKTATITVTGCESTDKNLAIVEVRNANNEVVDCHIDYEYNVITITAKNPPAGMYAVVHCPSSYTIS